MFFGVMRNGKMVKSKGLGGAYSGAKGMGDLDNWRILTSDANDILEGSHELLTTRSATLYHTYGPVKAAVNKQTEYAIGPGLVFRSQPDAEVLGISPDEAVLLGKKIQKIVHYSQKRMNFYEKQSILFRTALFIGDSILKFRRELETGLLDDLIEMSGNNIDSSCSGANYTLGIKHDADLRREGIKKTDGKEIPFVDGAGNQVIIQFYLKELARQLRGYPLAYTIINLARNDDTHWDAITNRAVMEAVMLATFKGDQTDLGKQTENLANANKKNSDASVDPGKQGGKPTLTTRIGNFFRMGAGNIYTIGTNESLDLMDMKTPSSNFQEFKSAIIQYVGMATGTPPEVIKGEYATSFTAHKGALNDFIKSFMKKRRTFERTVMNPTIREIVKDAILRNEITLPGFLNGTRMVQEAYLQGMYLGPVPGHINPLVEVRADELSVKNSFKLRSDIAAQNEHDYDLMFTEWTKEQDKFTDVPSDYASKVFEQETGGTDENN